ncbi:glutathionylspermidine synthase family protein [Jiella sp. MQZ9-1]|uniref:Glutathionylspermidine synthase family protein n=1 Tax=Jiella flava TaxID=2816857 RepID=A0A939JWL6_9HYPH|nr:glutathionylspermidine synthase family protein [Jiella flava]MBO0663172.1 glutathionylspermidine synthase family protein [Jiella flava]MCD2471590.1 glutathionylspermidine synthase family protein [Jiella flava]
MKRIDLPERENWRQSAEAVGFGFHEMYGEPYWVDDAAYVFSLAEIEEAIEAPSQELHDMCMDLVADVVRDEASMDALSVPQEMRDLVAKSWRDGDKHLYGRFDLAYDGSGPAKLLEYNADTPTSIFESAYFQYNWLTDNLDRGTLPEDADQYNSIQERLVEAFAAFSKDPIFHFAAWTESDEDRGTAAYLMDCAVQAGHRTMLLDIREIGVDEQGRFTDTEDRVIDQLFKLYPWEDMLREPFAKHLSSAGAMIVEPPWKTILSNKGILPLLWDRHAGHPNLLPAYFAGDERATTLRDAVRKPLFSREGENVEVLKDGARVEVTEGSYGEEGFVVQQWTPLFEAGGAYAVLGSWIVGDQACGLGMREDRSPITRNLSRFVPHMILE